MKKFLSLLLVLALTLSMAAFAFAEEGVDDGKLTIWTWDPTFNIAAMSFDPEGVLAAIRKYKPEFEMDYEVDPLKQANADSWPNSLDDYCAQQEWDWKAEYDLDAMTVDMLSKLREKLIH